MQNQEDEKTNESIIEAPPPQRPVMLGTINLDQLIDYYENQIILMHRLLQDRQREVERLARKLEGR